MKRSIGILALIIACTTASAQQRTLIASYTFSGTDKKCSIAVDEFMSSEGWYGRATNTGTVPLRGNGQIRMTDAEGKTLYATAFSTLFQEWQATEEATRTVKSFENVFLLPMPSDKAEVTIELYDLKGNIAASLSHPIDPSDILIRPVGASPAPCRHIHKSGDPRSCIDVAIVAEGYTKDEMDIFLKDAGATVESIFSHDPFSGMRDRFNFVAVELESRESGVSIPAKGEWKDTALGSNFDTFYSDRYLTTLHLKNLHTSLAGIPYEHIIILANTDNYGGGGIFNSYTLTTAHHKLFHQVVVHEFGHSFAGLADEYFYDDQFVEYYYPETEPWEQNITTRKDFHSKWEDMIGHDGVGLIEGGGYQSKGVWRACNDCRMRTNVCKDFCPVCRRAIERIIRFYTEEN